METYWKPWPLPGYTLASLHYYCQESNAVSYCHNVKDNVDDYIWTAIYDYKLWQSDALRAQTALEHDGVHSDWGHRFTM